MITLVALLALGAPEVNCRSDFPTWCTAGLKPDQKAPFSGVLMTGGLAAHLYLTEKNEQRQTDLAVNKATDLKDIQIQHQKDLNQIDKAAFTEKIKVLNKAHKRELELAAPSWYEHPALVLPAGIVLGVVSVLVAKEVMEASNK